MSSNKKESKKNFWIAVSLPIAIMIGYGSYMIYAYSTGLHNDFKRRGGQEISEADIRVASITGQRINTAKEAIAFVRDHSKILEKIDQRKNADIKKEEGYRWTAYALMDKGFNHWDVTFRELKVKPSKTVCQARVSKHKELIQDLKCRMR